MSAPNFEAVATKAGLNKGKEREQEEQSLLL